MATADDAALLAGRDRRFVAAVAAIDAANADDPATLVVDGAPVGKELAHARLMCAWVRRLDPEADDCQLLAARAHHLRRWALPRSEYADGRSGYLRWRTEQKKRHAVAVADILEPLGYGTEEVARVAGIIRKQGLATDPAVQVHEDALCLVFLSTQLEETLDRLGEDKMVDVVAKTMEKMSPAGLVAAGTLALGERASAVVSRAAETLGGR